MNSLCITKSLLSHFQSHLLMLLLRGILVALERKFIALAADTFED